MKKYKINIITWVQRRLKETVSVISSDPSSKDGNVDLLRYPWNLNLFKNMEDAVVFLTPKVFVSFNIASYKQEMRKSLSQRNHKWKLTY